MNHQMGVHETLELHELLPFKNLCLTKSSTMSALVQDEQLRNILDQDASSARNHIQELQSFVTKGVQA